VLPVTGPNKVVVVGLGEVGRPIFELVSKQHHAIGVDISPPLCGLSGVHILHICFPFGIEDFVEETARYITLFRPSVTIINSTVAVGTTRAVALRTGAVVVNSPVRGKHAHMTADLCRYTKFVGAMNATDAELAADHFHSLGMKTSILSSPEATELAKLTETTYFGLMIAWAQEIERYCDRLGQNYEQVVSFYDEINFFPRVKYFPGVIGGHCVMPNIRILRQLGNSEMLAAIESSNKQKIERDAKNTAVQLESKDSVAARDPKLLVPSLYPQRARSRARL
jgi:UDP-N-acetyl-D-mannosaminuronate dehydrogenase